SFVHMPMRQAPDLHSEASAHEAKRGSVPPPPPVVADEVAPVVAPAPQGTPATLHAPRTSPLASQTWMPFVPSSHVHGTSSYGKQTGGSPSSSSPPPVVVSGI